MMNTGDRLIRLALAEFCSARASFLFRGAAVAAD
jgi:hypothetical protein